MKKNVIFLGLVSFFNDLSSEMIFPFLPIFLRDYLGASAIFLGLVEGLADSAARILKIISGRLSDKWEKRKPFVVFGYSLSAVMKPLLSLATLPIHVLGLRFIDRVGKGTRDAPRDALISFSTAKEVIGQAFGLQRALDTLGGALGPLLAFFILPVLDNDLRKLFLFSFFASFLAVFCLIFFVREIKKPRKMGSGTISETEIVPDPIFRLRELGAPFLVFVGVATLFSLGKGSEAFLILRAEDSGVVLGLLPIIYLLHSMTYAIFSTPAGMLADRIGHRRVFVLGIFVFAISYFAFAKVAGGWGIWFLFAFYGLYAALTDGVGRAIVAELTSESRRATAYGIYNALTGIALLPGSLIFGFLWDRYGFSFSFYYGAAMAALAIIVFLIFFRPSYNHI